MKYTKKICLLTLGLMLSISLFAQYDMSAPLPLDKNIRIGKLKNGITYYIRKNQEPKERASFYIIQNVGALLENDNQNGLAHFLEHMAFNGTKHFPGKGITNTLQRYGVSFGGNINAYTAHDETVYNLSDVPTTNDKLVDTCLLILHDWSHYLSLTDSEIDSERGVISEEWRTRKDARGRIMSQTFPVMFEGSQYAKRDVIGDLNVINNFEYKTLRDFYHDWYRTDLQAIVVVGDIDVDKIEAKIKERFSGIPAVENAKPRPVFEIPARKDIGYVCATDKEATSSSVGIYMISKDLSTKNLQSVKDSYIDYFYNAMLGSRISELVQKGDENLMKGGAGVGGFVRGYKAYSISAASKPNKEAEALESVYKEIERAKRFGFTQSELDRTKAAVLTNLDNSYKQRDKISNEEYVDEIKTLFLENNPVVDIEYYVPLAKSVIASITAEDIAKAARELPNKENMVITVSGPSEGVKHITKEETLALMDKIEKSDLKPYQDNVGGKALINESDLKGSKIIKTKKLPMFGAEEWTLSNGAKVVFAKADFNKNVINMSAISYGGTSLYGVDILPAAGITSQLMGAFGIADFDATTLGKMLTGKAASANAKISSLSEAIQGSSSTNDFETMMQLTYLRFEKPRFDPQAFNAIMSRTRSSIISSKGTPQAIMSDSMSLISTNYNPRTILMDEHVVDKIKIEDVEKIYRDRIKDASDFTFFIVGDIDAATVKPLVEKYIGSITSYNRKESWKDNKVRGPKGKTVKEIIIPFETPKASVMVSMSKPAEYNMYNALCVDVLQGILDLRYTENIREKEGGTYGVNVSSGYSMRPYGLVSLSMSFDCDPDKANHLKSLIYKEISSIIAEGVTEKEVDQVIKNILKNKQQSETSNGYVLGNLYSYYDTGIDASDPKNFEEILKKIKPADIKKFTAKMFSDKADVIDIIFRSPKQ